MAKHFEYVHLQSDIHRFKWLSRSEDSANEYYDFITQIYDDLPAKITTVRILHDYQHLSFVPLANVFPKLKLLQTIYPKVHPRVAYLSNVELTETLLKSMTIMANRTGNRHFFKSNEERLAIEWLLKTT